LGLAFFIKRKNLCCDPCKATLLDMAGIVFKSGVP
jgi:hypothetical protein